MYAFVFEKAFHHAVSRLATGFMVYPLDLFKGGSFGFVLGVLAVLPVVVVSIRTNPHMLQQPVDSKTLRILVDELVSYYLVSFA